jgi:hypothetical protein
MTNPDIEAWDAWHPRQMADRLKDLDATWYVAAGWAVDLFRRGHRQADAGRSGAGQSGTGQNGTDQNGTDPSGTDQAGAGPGWQSREHEDLEIAVPAGSFGLLPPMFPELEFWVPISPGKLAPLTPALLAGDSHQTWAWDPAAQKWRFDVFRDPHDGDVWICRRDEERIRRPYGEIIRRTADGIPFLAIEVALLFKAKHQRAKDEADFEGALPLLSPAERGWLDDALGLVHPEHPWRARLR